MDYSPFKEDARRETWKAPQKEEHSLQSINLAPLKGVIESDPIRSKVLKLLIEDGGWVTTTDLLKTARQVRSIIGAVTIGTMMNGLNELVSSRLILSRTSLASGLDWAEWRINPDWIDPTRKLLQMLNRPHLFSKQKQVEKEQQPNLKDYFGES
jgi:hypothetical protein